LQIAFRTSTEYKRREVNRMDKKALKIIEDENLDILCAPFKDTEETFCIVGGWDDVGKLVSLYNNLDHLVPDGDIRTDSATGEFLGDLHEKGDWDNTPPFIVPEGLKEMEDILEADWGFSDEYAMCDDTGKVVRTSPDSYGWTPDYWLRDSEIICDIDPKEYIAECKNKLMNCNLVDPEEHGYVKIEKEFSTGLYEWANDDPKKLMEALNKEGIDVVFQVYPSQFTQDWEIYVPKNQKKETERLLDEISHKYEYGKSPAELTKKYLEEASEIVSEMRAKGEKGIIYAKPTEKGKAKVRVVSPKEFVKGIKD